MHVQMHVCTWAHVSGGAGSRAPCSRCFSPATPTGYIETHHCIQDHDRLAVGGVARGGPGPFMILDVAPVMILNIHDHLWIMILDLGPS
jgi:hypothetical protein